MQQYQMLASYLDMFFAFKPIQYRDSLMT